MAMEAASSLPPPGGSLTSGLGSPLVTMEAGSSSPSQGGSHTSAHGSQLIAMETKELLIVRSWLEASKFVF
jgi:hypothetical protein